MKRDEPAEQERNAIEQSERTTGQVDVESTDTTETLSEKLSAGGCCEAWEAMSELREENHPARRGFMKRAAGGVLGIPGANFVLNAFNDESQQPTSDVTINWLDGAESNRVAAQARGTSEYRELLRYARENGNKVRPRSQNIRTARIVGDRTLEVFVLDVEGIEEDRSSITIGWDAENEDDKVIAGLEYMTKTTVDASDFEGAQATGYVQVPAEVKTVDALNGMEENTYEISFDESTDRQRRRGGLSAQSFGPTFQSSSILCNGCSGGVGIVCAVGCGAPVYVACGAIAASSISVGSLPGGACAAFVTVVCGLIEIFACGPALTEAVCEDRYNVC